VLQERNNDYYNVTNLSIDLSHWKASNPDGKLKGRASWAFDMNNGRGQEDIEFITNSTFKDAVEKLKPIAAKKQIFTVRLLP
jgi:hypothetical protein